MLVINFRVLIEPSGVLYNYLVTNLWVLLRQPFLNYLLLEMHGHCELREDLAAPTLYKGLTVRQFQFHKDRKPTKSVGGVAHI